MASTFTPPDTLEASPKGLKDKRKVTIESAEEDEPKQNKALRMRMVKNLPSSPAQPLAPPFPQESKKGQKKIKVAGGPEKSPKRKRAKSQAHLNTPPFSPSCPSSPAISPPSPASSTSPTLSAPEFASSFSSSSGSFSPTPQGNVASSPKSVDLIDPDVSKKDINPKLKSPSSGEKKSKAGDGKRGDKFSSMPRPKGRRNSKLFQLHNMWPDSSGLLSAKDSPGSQQSPTGPSSATEVCQLSPSLSQCEGEEEDRKKPKAKKRTLFKSETFFLSSTSTSPFQGSSFSNSSPSPSFSPISSHSSPNLRSLTPETDISPFLFQSNETKEIAKYLVSLYPSTHLIDTFLAAFAQFGINEESLFEELTLLHSYNPKGTEMTVQRPTPSPLGNSASFSFYPTSSSSSPSSSPSPSPAPSSRSLSSSFSSSSSSSSPSHSHSHSHSHSFSFSPSSSYFYLEELESGEEITVTPNPIFGMRLKKQKTAKQYRSKAFDEGFRYIYHTWVSQSCALYESTNPKLFQAMVSYILSCGDPKLNKIKLMFLRKKSDRKMASELQLMRFIAEGKDCDVKSAKELKFCPRLFKENSVGDVGNAITYVMFGIFKAIGPSELHDGAWQGKEKRSRAPHLHALSLVFNWISLLCEIEILFAETSTEREENLLKCVELAIFLKKNNNFEGMSAVVTTFSKAAIKRLKPVWGGLNQKTARRAKKMEGILQPLKNFKAYWGLYNSCDGPKLPWFAPKLKELRYMYDGNKKFAENGIIDYDCLQATGVCINGYLKLKTEDYNIATPELVNVIALLEDVTVVDPDELEDILYERSLSIYPTQQT